MTSVKWEINEEKVVSVYTIARRSPQGSQPTALSRAPTPLHDQGVDSEARYRCHSEPATPGALRHSGGERGEERKSHPHAHSMLT